MTCILHYEGLQNYDELSPITAKTSDNILLAKTMHESSKDRDHEVQCNSIPLDGLTNCYYHKNPCYKKFVRITVKSKCKGPPKPSTKISIVKTRSKRNSSTKFEELPAPSKKNVKTQPATRKPRRRGTSTLATSSSRNKFVFGKECVLCEKYELRAL